nr:MAG TPA: hypothetical protein [Caudoviricetes sp.]
MFSPLFYYIIKILYSKVLTKITNDIMIINENEHKRTQLKEGE